MSFELCCCCCSGSLLLRGAVIGLRRSRAKKWARMCERERERRGEGEFFSSYPPPSKAPKKKPEFATRKAPAFSIR